MINKDKSQFDSGSQELAIWIANVLEKKGGLNISVIDTRNTSAVADYLVIATGTSSRHLGTLLESPIKELKHAGFPPLSVEGEGTHWMLADLGDVILHIFDAETRNYFDLDNLWQEAERVDWEIEPSQIGLASPPA